MPMMRMTPRTAALDARRAHFGPDRPEMYDSLNLLGSLREEQGRYDDVMELYQQAREGRARFYGPAHSETMNPGRGLIRSLTAAERFDDAERMALEALAVCREADGDDDSTTTQIRELLVTLYERWNRPDEAARYRPAWATGVSP